MAQFPRKCLRRRRSWREAVTVHDLHHFDTVRWATSRRIDYIGRFAKVLRTDRRRRDQTQHLHIAAGVVVETVDGAAGNAERLSRPHLDLLAIHSPSHTPSMP